MKLGLRFLIPFLFCLAAIGQTNRGSITGTVTDPSGGLVSGATVTAVERATTTTYHAATTAAGTYSFPQLLVGTYDLTIAAPNFSTAKRTGVVVQINTATVVDVQLAVGAESTVMTVVADVPTVQSTTSDVGGIVTSRQVVDLPLSLGGVGALRSPEAFAFLLPGTIGPGTANNANGIYFQKTSGGLNFGDEVILDGGSAIRPDNGSTFDETAPSVEALQEFRVTTATPPAQFGRTTGGIRSFTTHSGQNTVHGTAFDILRNTLLDANTWFNNLHRATCTGSGCNGLGTPKDIRNDFGVALGGPVYIPRVYNGKDKTFFYFAWEQVRWPRNAVGTTTVPTAQERAGDFTQLLTTNQIGTNPCTGAPVVAGQIFDPATNSTGSGGQQCRTPFAGNIIPASRFDPIAQAVLPYIPLPNAPGLVNNYTQNTSLPTDNTTFTLRFDQNVSTTDKMFFMFDTRENTLRTGGTAILPDPVDPVTWFQDFRTFYARIGWDRTLSATMLNHVNLSFNRWDSGNNSPGVVAGVDWPARLGLAGVHGPTFPQMNLGGGFPAIGQARGDDGIGNEAVVSDTLSWSRGRHTLTVGGEYRFMQFNNLSYDNQSGVYNFSSAQTSAGQGVLASQGGASFASFLLGQVSSANLNVFAHYPRYNQHYYALFVQDDFKVGTKLTLNLGLRWDVDTPRKEAQNYTSNFNPTIPNPGAGGRPGALEFASNCNGCNVRWAKTFYDDFAPRIGFAYAPFGTSTTAIRGGYAILYGPMFYSDFGNSMSAGYSASPNPVSSNGFDPAFLLRNGFPAYPAAPILDPTIRNNQSVDYITPGFGKPAMIQTWNIQFQQQLAPDLIGSVAYVGNKGQNLRTAAAFGMYNNIRPQSLALGQAVLNAPIGSALANAAGVTAPYPGFTGTVGNALRPYPQYRRFNTDCCLENEGMSTYHSLQAQLTRRFRAGLNLQVSYTFSKNLTNTDSMFPGQNAGGGLYQDPFNLKLEKSVSSQDIPHVFVASYIYELPIGKGKKFLNRGGWVDAVLGGWQVGAIHRYQSGQPLPFYCAAGVSGWDNCFRFDPAPGQTVFNPARNQPGFNPLTTPYLNNSYFVEPNANPNAGIRFGMLPRVTNFRMQWYLNEDVNVMKRIMLREPVRLELRGEAFNVANRHVFAQPFNLGPNPNAGAASNFGFINGTANLPRLMQVEARILF